MYYTQILKVNWDKVREFDDLKALVKAMIEVNGGGFEQDMWRECLQDCRHLLELKDRNESNNQVMD